MASTWGKTGQVNGSHWRETPQNLAWVLFAVYLNHSIWSINS
jgi:hypothetical protein